MRLSITDSRTPQSQYVSGRFLWERPLCFLPRLFGVVEHEFIQAFDQRVLEALLHRQLAPLQILLGPDTTVALVLRSELHETLRRIGTPVEDDVLDCFAQFRVDLLVNAQLPGIHNTHVHTRLDGIIEEHAVHRLPYRFVPAEGEGDITDAAADPRKRHPLLDLFDGFDKVDGVVIVLFDAGGDSKDIRIENDVLRRETQPLREDVVSPLADIHFFPQGVGLAILVEGHDDDGSTIAPADNGLLDELFLSFLHGN